MLPFQTFLWIKYARIIISVGNLMDFQYFQTSFKAIKFGWKWSKTDCFGQFSILKYIFETEDEINTVSNISL